MAQMAKDQMAKCPESKLVLSGYSQGAEQVHGALKNLGAKAAQVGVCNLDASVMIDKADSPDVGGGDLR